MAAEEAFQASLRGEAPPSRRGRWAWLAWLCASRTAVSLAFMMYAGVLPHLIQAWGMTAAEGGFVQTCFNVSYAVSLVLTGWLSDRLGARRLFLWSSAASAVAALLVAGFARSFESGALLFALLGLSQGGTYTPSIMLVAQGVAPGRRGFAIGLLLAGASLGYAGSIALSTAASQIAGYQAAFLLCGAAPLLAALAAWRSVRDRPNLVGHRRGRTAGDEAPHPRQRRWAVLLTLGYTAHCWELLGMWAWLPTFLLTFLAASSLTGALAQGLWIGIAIHLSGCLSAFTMGHASDRLGRRAVLVGLGLFGAACSFAMGWLGEAPAAALLLLGALYGFAALGDSPVLSTAITETVAPSALGSALAIRSILGFGAGGLAPLAFGLARDAAPAGLGWIVAFSCLGVGGLLAALFALRLPRQRPGAAPANLSEPGSTS
ncbi:Sugar phosphate permease [Tistlia consotensis]|uniref:Sugar phosphate permease n=1 Tax=Tistlia consotensis USBA 355 TaxID=560819 RepID=A0A1Y6CI71_9PROT|nr:MFS transporter [Tistlia consotensis]SMF55695.1 Sugar phosphate permease [Tistlia consotensis USBA 355]SNR89034.1 Sugar phosphate permease [Tistlia consotensis]